MNDEDSEECGDVYSLTAIKSDTRLFLFHHEGKRSTEDAIELFNEVEKMRNASSLFLYLPPMIGMPLKKDS